METLDENLLLKKEEAPLTDSEVFTKIWTSPRLVFNFLNKYKYEKYMHLLLLLAGISKAFDRASSKNMGDSLPFGAVLGVCLVFGGLLGWIAYYIYAALLSWIGQWLNGKGGTFSLLRVLSYGMIPSIAALTLLIPQLILFKNGIFEREFDPFNEGTAAGVIFYTTVLIEIVLSIWAIVLIVIGISVVQKISIGKSIINIILPALLFIVPIAFIVIVFDLFKS